MLTGSEVNPFDSQETKPYVSSISIISCKLKTPCSYKNDPEIKAMTDLVDAYQRREVHAAEKILRGTRYSDMGLSAFLIISSQDNRATIMEDGFIKSYIGELLRSLRTQYLIDLIKPYTRLELSFLAKVRLRLYVTHD